jgi:aspartyl-tRNA synthetase
MSELRLEIGNRLGLRNKDSYAQLWVVDFPLLEWNEDIKRWHAIASSLSQSPKPEDIPKSKIRSCDVRANAYDLVIMVWKSAEVQYVFMIAQLQQQMFQLLGFSDEEAKNQFGFLMNAFEYGAPPHGGIAFGFDRPMFDVWRSRLDPRLHCISQKIMQGRDVMIDSPSAISDEQLKELGYRSLRISEFPRYR